MKPRNILVTLECFVKKDGKYLMLHRNKDKKIMPNVWMAPGGKREFNEGLFECARREIMEETNLTIKNLQVKAIGNAYLKDLDQELFFHLLTADYAGGVLKENSEDGELVWLTPNDILALDNVLAELKEVLSYVVEEKGIISYTAVYEKGNQMTNLFIEKTI